ncbi:MAG: hypothetical protein ABIH23_23205, partial [bacterium]
MKTRIFILITIAVFLIAAEQANAQDSDGNLTAAAGVIEPVGLDSTVTTQGGATAVFDFTLTDGGGGDALALDVTQVVLHYSGSGGDALLLKVDWRLNGPDAVNAVGTVNTIADTITFAGLTVSVVEGDSEIYTVSAFYNDNTGLTEDQTIIVSIDGDTADLTVGGGGTQMGATTPVNNGTGSTVDIIATQLAFIQQPAPLAATSGTLLDFGTDPTVEAQDAVGNKDTDYTAAVTLSETGAG